MIGPGACPGVPWQTGGVAHPAEPPPSPWDFPCSAEAQTAVARGGEVVGIGADLEPGTLLAAYRCGLFPMPVGSDVAWWSPDPRGVIPLDGLVVTRSLRQSRRRFVVRFGTAFDDVVAACSDPGRPGAWISPRMLRAYSQLHELGWAQSVETWTPDGELVGGLYGVAIGGLFAGESMFHRRRDASKVALVALVEALRAAGAGLLDVQWQTPHLASLGAVEVSRQAYHRLLKEALALPQVCLSPL